MMDKLKWLSQSPMKIHLSDTPLNYKVNSWPKHQTRVRAISLFFFQSLWKITMIKRKVFCLKCVMHCLLKYPKWPFLPSLEKGKLNRYVSIAWNYWNFYKFTELPYIHILFFLIIYVSCYLYALLNGSSHIRFFSSS